MALKGFKLSCSPLKKLQGLLFDLVFNITINNKIILFVNILNTFFGFVFFSREMGEN